MSKKFVQYEAEDYKGWKLWKIEGRIDVKTSDEAYMTGEEIIRNNDKTILDMSQIDYISSAGLRVLLRLNKLAMKTGKSFALADPVCVVMGILHDSAMDEVLDIRDSLEDLD